MVFPLWKTTAIRQKYESQIVLHAHQPIFFFFFLKLIFFKIVLKRFSCPKALYGLRRPTVWQCSVLRKLGQHE